jgi:large subunit ribosomal protein L4
MRLSKKVNRLARRSALSVRAAEEMVRVLEDFQLEGPRTKQVAAMLEALELKGEKVLILTKDHDPNLVKSVRNVPGCAVRVGIEASTYDLLNHRVILIQEGALEGMTEVLRGRKRSAEKAA